MIVGIKILELLYKLGIYEQLNWIIKRFVDGLLVIVEEIGYVIYVGYISVMFGIFFYKGLVYNYEYVKKFDLSKFSKFYCGMLEYGIYLVFFQFEVGFIFLVYIDEDIDQILVVVKEVMFSF